MDRTSGDPGPDGSPLRVLDEHDPPESLNTACLLDNTDLSFNEHIASPDFSSFLIPETPSPVFRGKRHARVTDDHSRASKCDSDMRRPAIGDLIPGSLHTTPQSQRALKRRRLQDSGAGGNGFIPASSLLAPDCTWFDSPCPSTSTFASPSTSTASSSAGAPEHSGLRAATAQNYLIDTPPRDFASELKKLRKSSKEQNKKRPKRKNTRITPRSSRSAASTSLHGGGEEERYLPDAETGRRGNPVNPPACQIQEEIIIIDEDEEDNVVVEAMVRSIQMAEDEAFARSLQEQFDREEQERRRQQAMPPHRHTHNHSFDSYVGFDWISPLTAMVNSPTFRDFTGQGDGNARQPRARRARNPRHRQTPQTAMDLLDDSQGNNYEALLQFEELQGTAVAKNTLSKQDIERLPTKVYDPAHNAGKTVCQICFCDYEKGENLRMLPCLHDYHVQCIDRWLKESSTCPICRSDVSERGDFP